MLNRYTDVSYETQVALSGRLLATFYPVCVVARFGQPEVQQKNTGQVRKWRRPSPIPPAVAPVADGQTPPGTRVEYTDYETRIEEYVHVVELTDQVADTHLDPVLQERTDALAEANKQTVELVSISVLSGGTQAMYAGGTQRSEVNAPPSNGDFIKILRALDNALAQPISKIIAASGNIATQPVEGGFYAFCHTNLQADLEHITGFTKKVNYANPGQAVPGEFGALGRIRFIATPNFKPWLQAGVSGSTYLTNNGTGTGACDVYPIIIFGKDAYGTVSLRGYDSAKIYVLAPGEARGGDPAGQRGSVSSKIWYSCVILCQPHLVRYECACTANPNW